jgi:GT2 family glycosyltransferase/glycosyltransferase involved in cell wall biosynthesis
LRLEDDGRRSERDGSIDLSVVIVNWSTREDLRVCLTSLAAATAGLAAETLVVDNASSDGSAEMVRESFPSVELIENRRNAGFARANNQAFARARGRYILLLNPDTVVNGEALRGLLDFMDRTPGAGAAGLQLRFPDGRLQNSYDSFPTFGSELLSKHLLRALFPARYPSKRVIPQGPLPVDIVIGACLILRQQVVETLRGFDEGYFLFVEEADLCFRIRRAGWEIYHLPHLSIVHNAMASKAQANAHAAIEYARSSYRFYPRCLGLRKAVVLAVLKALKATVVNPALSLAACAFTLGRVPRHLRRLRVRSRLLAWHLLGCPASWGMREVSSLRHYQRSREGDRELIVASDSGPGLRAFLESFTGRIPGLSGVAPGPLDRAYRIADPDGRGELHIAVSRPGPLGWLRALRSVPEGLSLLERGEEARDRGIPAIVPVAAGCLRRLGVPWLSFAVYREERGLSPVLLAMLAERKGRLARLHAAARFLRDLHDAGIDPGPHFGAAVLVPSDPAGSPVLADARRIRTGPPLLRGERMASLRRLAAAAPQLHSSERRRFLSAYWRPEWRSRLRVLHLFANYKVTGPAETALDVARELGALDSIVTEFASGRGPRGETLLRRLAVTRGARVPDMGLELRKHLSALNLAGDVLRLRRSLRADPPDVIHCHSQGDHLLAALAAPREIPVVRSYYGVEAPPLDWRTRRTILGRCDRLIVYSLAAKSALAAAPFWMPAGKLRLIEPPIDTDRFDPARELPDRRAAFGIPPGAFAAGISARLQTHRRFEVLFDAMVLARREAPDIRLVVIGRGTHAETVAREPVRRLGLEGAVHLAGYLSGDEYVAALKALDAAIFLVPGSDGTCRAVREELAMGLPVIAARRGILPELVRHGETGLIVEDTAEGLAAALVALARDPERRKRMAAAARADARARFSHHSHSATVASIYREVVARDTDRRPSPPPEPRQIARPLPLPKLR